MKKKSGNPATEGSISSMPLHQLINKVMVGLLPLAVSKKSFVLNDVSPEVYINADENMLAFVLSTLLNETITATENECIRVEFVSDEQGTLISVKTLSHLFYSNSTVAVKEMQDAAEMMGACISISPYKNGTLATCSFMKALKVA